MTPPLSASSSPEPVAAGGDPRDAYSADQFAAPQKDCDLVMKGGVTSGLVYPYAILELARVYRFKSIGGTSAGAIAAAFAAAAEYSRTVRKDPAGFLRLKAHCDTLPANLAHLFQPAPPFRDLMRALLGAQAAEKSAGAAWAVVKALWRPLLLGGATLGGLMALAQGGAAGVLLGILVGLVVGIGVRLWHMLQALPQHDYGLSRQYPAGRRRSGFDRLAAHGAAGHRLR
jgi:type IV secretory pathway TrbD component